MQEVIIIPARRSVVIRGGEGRASVIARRRSLDYTLSGGVFFFFSVCKRVEDSKREDEEHNRPFRINSTFDHLSPGKRAPRNTTPAPPPSPVRLRRRCARRDRGVEGACFSIAFPSVS